MYARAFGPVCRPGKAPDVVHHLHQRRFRNGHGGEAEGGDAVAAIVLGEGGDLLRRAVAGVQPGGAVGMHVDKAGHHIGALGVQARAGGEAGDGLGKFNGAGLKMTAAKNFCVIDQHEKTLLCY